jgi:hypothetical protein
MNWQDYWGSKDKSARDEPVFNENNPFIENLYQRLMGSLPGKTGAKITAIVTSES